MPIISPSITAQNEEEYHEQIAKIAHLAHRIHIDLADGVLAPHKLLDPKLAWWPAGMKADFHLMYKNPLSAARAILTHRPHLIIIHAEADGDFKEVAELCRHHKVRVGVAMLEKTSPHSILPALPLIDHVLIFSGNLGKYGGRADLKLLNKSSILKQHKPELEIGWDGGINDQNVAHLVNGGVDVLNVGGYLQDAPDPVRAFNGLQRIADETVTA